ncbi:MAG: hypothetical protein ACPHK8_06975 [Thermoplasmatota archaeon]
MKRFLPLLLIFMAPAALAEGCLEEDPCPWNLDLEDDGIESSLENATTGDWFLVEAFSFASETRTLTVGSHGSVTLESLGSAELGPFQIGTESFKVTDSAGHEIQINVFEADFIEDGSSSAAASSQETPFPSGLALVGLAALALARK